MIRILIADDHAVVRSGVKLILTGQPDFEVIGEAGTGEETVDKTVALRPEILLLDMAMPDLNGLDAARLIRDQVPEVAIIVLSMYDDEAYLRQFLEIGAAGYVLKKAADTELVDAIRAVSRGDPFIYPSLTRQLIESYLQTPAASPDTTGPDNVEELSPRETEVLRLVALGYTGQQIADQLYISVSTVESHRGHIMDKLGLRGRAQLVRYALSRGLLDETGP